jgi:hypothetical protein
MDNTNIPITLSEIPPRRQSSGLSFLLRSRDQSNSEGNYKKRPIYHLKSNTKKPF